MDPSITFSRRLLVTTWFSASESERRHVLSPRTALWEIQDALHDDDHRFDLCEMCRDDCWDFSRVLKHQLIRMVSDKIESGRLLVVRLEPGEWSFAREFPPALPQAGAVPSATSAKNTPAAPRAVGAVSAPTPKLPPPPPGVATKDQGDKLFKDLAARKDIPFDYPVDCCYTRAHVMAKDAEKTGLKVEKLWYFDKDWGTSKVGASLHPKTATGSPVAFPDRTGVEREVQWVYHVAPLIKVQQADGSIEKRVFDPSISDHPLSTAEWKALQGAPSGAYEEISDADAYFSNAKHEIREEDPDLSLSQNQLAKHRMDRDAARAAAAKKTNP